MIFGQYHFLYYLCSVIRINGRSTISKLTNFNVL